MKNWAAIKRANTFLDSQQRSGKGQKRGLSWAKAVDIDIVQEGGRSRQGRMEERTRVEWLWLVDALSERLNLQLNLKPNLNLNQSPSACLTPHLRHCVCACLRVCLACVKLWQSLDFSACYTHLCVCVCVCGVGGHSRATVAVLSMGQPFCCLLLGAQIAAASRKKGKRVCRQPSPAFTQTTCYGFHACLCECVSKILLYLCEIGAPGTHNFKGTRTTAPASLRLWI